MHRWILSALLLACSPDVSDECESDDDCAALGSDLFCFDNLCVDDPPDQDPLEPDPVVPPADEPHFVGCGAVAPGQIGIESTGTDSWRMTGATSETRLLAGHCGGAGDDGVFRINFEVPGVYTLAVDPSIRFSTTLSIRKDCVDATSETACGRSSLTVPGLVIFETTSTDEALYLLIDAGGVGGEFELSAVRSDAHQAPAIEAATVWSTPGQAALRVAGADANGDVEAIELTWLDADDGPLAEPIDAPLRPSPLGMVMFTARAELSAPPAGATAALLRLRDTRAALSPALRVDLRPLTELGADTPCEPTSTAERCQVGLVCPAVSAPTCRLPTAPQAVSHRASIDAESAIFEVVVTDPDRDWARIDWQPLTAGGEALAQRAALRLHEMAAGTAEQIVHARVALHPTARRYRLWTVSAHGLEDGVEGVFDQPPQGRFGDACDPLGLRLQCEPGTRCRDSFDAPECWPARPATIEAVDAWFNPDAGTFGVRIEAYDQAGLAGIKVDDTLLVFHRVSRAGTQAVGWGAWRLDPPPAEIRVLNQLGQLTDALAIAIDSPPEAPLGGGCDPLEALAICPAGRACVSIADDGVYICE